jgi:hypothetical protein
LLKSNYLEEKENLMKTQTLFRFSGKILAAVAVSLVMLALVYAFQHPNLVVTVATIGWNG